MPLDETQRKTLLDQIESRRARLLLDLRRATLRFGEMAGEVRDRGDEAVASLYADLNQAQTLRDTLELQALEEACPRLDNGVYGHCIDCDTELEYPRLLAEPAALRCVECQEHHDAVHGNTFPAM